MRLGQTQERLRTMLRETDLDLERLDPRGTWNVFKLFAAEPVEGAGPAADDDMCLFEYGVYDWSDGKGPRFSWNLCRQFTIYEDGEYDRIEQLRCGERRFRQPVGRGQPDGAGLAFDHH